MLVGLFKFSNNLRDVLLGLMIILHVIAGWIHMPAIFKIIFRRQAIPDKKIFMVDSTKRSLDIVITELQETIYNSMHSLICFEVHILWRLCTLHYSEDCSQICRNTFEASSM